MMNQGALVISIDFELHWGVSDHRTISSYNENLRNVPAVVTRTLELFATNKIRATWATVGMLFCHSKEELFSKVSPENRPTYLRTHLSNYTIAEMAGENEEKDPYHFANSLVKLIVGSEGQELATHTFSHYYCLEPGQTLQQFHHDLAAAKELISREGANAVSIVFPRNQYNEEYLAVCSINGFHCYRGNFPSWLYRPEAKSEESSFKRLARLADTYFPVTGDRIVIAEKKGRMVNVPASCFLRPYNNRLSLLEPIRVARIKKEMTAAAKKNAIYHLWWHPHNFGKNMQQNFRTLESILEHFSLLSKKYGMLSMNMKDVYDSFS